LLLAAFVLLSTAFSATSCHHPPRFAHHSDSPAAQK